MGTQGKTDTDRKGEQSPEGKSLKGKLLHSTMITESRTKKKQHRKKNTPQNFMWVDFSDGYRTHVQV